MKLRKTKMAGRGSTKIGTKIETTYCQESYGKYESGKTVNESG